MRFWRIAVFVTLFELAVGVLAPAAGLAFDWASFQWRPVQGLSPDAVTVGPWGNPWYGVQLVLGLGASVVAGVYSILAGLGFPPELAALAQAAVAASQAAAVAELVTGRRLEG